MMKSSNIESREKTIVKTSALGVAANAALALIKAVVGLLANSIAIVLDAVNNLSDALSSVITIVGTKIAGKPADKKHPYGHGRVEYISALVIAVIILYAGITSLVESVKKIILPEAPDYTAVSLVIVGIAVVAKIVLGLYVKSVGKRVNSDSLSNSGQDALLDAIISAATLVAAIVFSLSGVSLEAYLGAIISLLIIKAGVEMAWRTISRIVGERTPAELSKGVKNTVSEFEEVKGVYDLFLNNYGPDIYNGSLHIEIDDSLTAVEIDELTRRISEAVYLKNGVILTAIGIYSRNTGDNNANKVYKNVRDTVMSKDGVMQMHGFYLNEKEGRLTFDIIIDFAVPDRRALYEEIYREVAASYPEYSVRITLDNDMSD